MEIPNPNVIPQESLDTLHAAKEEMRTIPVPFHDTFPTTLSYIEKLESTEDSSEPSSDNAQVIAPSLIDLTNTEECSILPMLAAPTPHPLPNDNKRKTTSVEAPGNEIDDDNPALSKARIQ